MVDSGKTIMIEAEESALTEGFTDGLDEGMPEINPAKVCFVIIKARELAVSEEGGDPMSGSNESDDGFASILTTRGIRSTEAELLSFIEALDVDEQCALVALMWIGRGDYTADDWPSAVAEALARRKGPTGAYLLGTPLLADYLETALSEFGESCDMIEMGRL